MMNEWMSPADLGDLAADELETAMARFSLAVHRVSADEEEVSVVFYAIQDAEAFLTLAVNAIHVPGSLYDRVASGCVTFADATDRGIDLSDERVDEVLEAGWTWTIHPDMHGRRVDWHVSVAIPVDDAIYVTSCLNNIGRDVL